MRELSRLDIFGERLASNYEVIQSLAPQARILPMVKANAYGHGLQKISQFLLHECLAPALGVASLGEALEIKTDRPVWVFSETLLQPQFASHFKKNIYPVVSDLTGLEFFLSAPEFKTHPLMIKIDTGMNRLGIAREEWPEAQKLIVQSGRKSIQHLMSHFATSYYQQKAGDMISRQMQCFREAQSFFASSFTIEETSMSNSGAIEQGLMVEESWVRPGLMLYGPGSFKTQTKMISRFSTRVMKLKAYERGTPIGYGVYVTPEAGLIALLPIGYGDGFFTQSSGFNLKINGIEGKVFGRVNMDMTAVFFKQEAAGKIKVGDEVVLWDENPQELLDWATQMQTHSYQAMCGISSRIPRVYHLG